MTKSFLVEIESDSTDREVTSADLELALKDLTALGISIYVEEFEEDNDLDG